MRSLLAMLAMILVTGCAAPPPEPISATDGYYPVVYEKGMFLFADIQQREALLAGKPVRTVQDGFTSEGMPIYIQETDAATRMRLKGEYQRRHSAR